MTVGEKIRKFRIDQGYTQKELAIMSDHTDKLSIRNVQINVFQCVDLIRSSRAVCVSYVFQFY